MGEPSVNLASTSPAGPDGVEQRLGRLDWLSLEGQLGARGYARTAPVLTAAECTGVASLYDDDGRFRTRIDMVRYNFGRGEYSYFDYPLPPLVATLRTCLYRHLAPLAGRMMAALGATERYPPDHEAYLRHCHAAGQARPTPLVLRYRAGDYNNLHRDLYGDVLFPLQATIMLSRRGDDYTGGGATITRAANSSWSRTGPGNSPAAAPSRRSRARCSSFRSTPGPSRASAACSRRPCAMA